MWKRLIGAWGSGDQQSAIHSVDEAEEGLVEGVEIDGLGEVFGKAGGEALLDVGGRSVAAEGDGSDGVSGGDELAEEVVAGAIGGGRGR